MERSRLIFVLALGALSFSAAAEPDFAREIQPILAANCFECHGPDEGARKAKMRLDQPGASALTDGEILARITSDDPDEVMPPPKSSKSLTVDEVTKLEAWISAGAPYAKHWAFVKPVKPELPAAGDDWARNSIDRFVFARLDAENLKPSPEADRYSLVRRVYLDLIGLPPTPEEADAFVNSKDPDAWSKLVQQLLASDSYGERWARPWLDLARYADTNGYEKDRPRSIWPYRDWVIKALNADMPFDQFTIEQLAGDMLPDASLDQKIATGFHRNTMMNEEGGIDPLEYRFYAVVDRVLTTGTTWMGLTTGCAQCHTHKYDPITHTDYFGLFALLNNASEPDLITPDTAALKKIQSEKPKIEARIEEVVQNWLPTDEFYDWIRAQIAGSAKWETLIPDELTTNLAKLEILPDGSIFATGDSTKRDVYTLKIEDASIFVNPDQPDEASKQITALRIEALPDFRLPAGGPGRGFYEGRKGDFFLSEVIVKVDGEPIAFGGASHTFGKISIGSGSAAAKNVYDGDGSTGWSTATREGEANELVLNLKEAISMPADLEIELLFERHFVASLGRFRISATTVPRKVVASSLNRLNSGASEAEGVYENLIQSGELRIGQSSDAAVYGLGDLTSTRLAYFDVAPDCEKERKEIVALRGRIPKLPTTMVFEERQPDNPRSTFRHNRGEYLQPKERVAPAVPAIFESLPDGESANRLTFAQWLVSERNPLGARVPVNRAWHQVFGRGIVESVADFGTQSSPPSHPELLDWLAVEFVEQGWSMKELHKLIVTSATYRQSSIITQQLLARDPQNVLLARGPRFRIDGEMIRDVALKSSGLLSVKMLGPSVYPPQDSRVAAAAYGGTKWNVSKGEDRFRRSLYTFSKRTAPFAAFTVFDGPTGETCTARRNRSNTPLQALTMLNDEMFVEMAEALAKRATEAAETPESRVEFIFRRCLTRSPTEVELARLLAFQKAQSDRLGDEALAWKLTARAVLNLDEFVTKQ
ncbi:MAG: hypothetical protein ACI8UO_003908 [Verrucomicrobiales bacterium]|jgi:hypothetical protein